MLCFLAPFISFIIFSCVYSVAVRRQIKILWPIILVLAVITILSLFKLRLPAVVYQIGVIILCLPNLKRIWAWLLAVGTLSNAVVEIANGLTMPVDPRITGTLLPGRNVMTPETHLPFLGDLIIFAGMSIGDILISGGLVALAILCLQTHLKERNKDK